MIPAAAPRVRYRTGRLPLHSLALGAFGIQMAQPPLYYLLRLLLLPAMLPAARAAAADLDNLQPVRVIEVEDPSMDPRDLAPPVSSGQAGAAEPAACLARDQPTHGGAFEVVSAGRLVEHSADAVLYRHTKTGAELLSVASPSQTEKVFGITFRTPPNNSHGAPHVLEHSVLAGSKQFRTKEPFVDLLKGSLQTFLNAMTFPDRTCYPVASQNLKDFHNLVNVYLDAVFFPRALQDPTVLAQEGWHYELVNTSEPLVYKGVVFNEMKGVYSSAEALLENSLQQALFPDISYGVDSGGDPREIPRLSITEFNNFHGAYYHPANSRLFFWGDDDVSSRLELADRYLTQFGPAPLARAASAVLYQPPFDSPRLVEVDYPAKAAAEGDEAATGGECATAFPSLPFAAFPWC